VRHQDFHNSRRRHSDADTYNPQPRAFGTRFSQARFEAPSGPPVQGVVKWFSPEKGFGFVELFDGSGDAFLHGAVLAQNRFGIVQPGDTLEVRVGPGHKGAHVTEVLSVDSSTTAPATERRLRFRSATSAERSSEMAVEETGTVKWFNAAKGYGFHCSGSWRGGCVHPRICPRTIRAHRTRRRRSRDRRRRRGSKGAGSREGSLGLDCTVSVQWSGRVSKLFDRGCDPIPDGCSCLVTAYY